MVIGCVTTEQLGQQWADRFKWKKAIQYYTLSGNQEKLLECYYRLEMFEELTAAALSLPDGTPVLARGNGHSHTVLM